MEENKSLEKTEKINTGINFKTGEEVDISSEDERWVEAKARTDGQIVIQTKSGKTLNIDRKGVTDKELGALMLSDELTREQKNAALSDYLFQEGKESPAFLAELFQSRGKFTKEARHFSSMMRFDFESFVTAFTSFLKFRAEKIVEEMALSDDWSKVKDSLLKYKGDLNQALAENNLLGGYSRAEMSLISLAAGFDEEAILLQKGVDKIKTQREKEKGMGVYVSTTGQVYDLTEMSIKEIVEKELKEFHEKKVDKNE